MAVTMKEIRECVDNWFITLPEICKIETPWIFLCLSALIDYLSSAAYPNAGTQADRYTKFIKENFSSKYQTLVYRNGKQDLPEQMYYVLRNGLVHSFSLVPNARSARRGGRVRSIALGHRSNSTPYHLALFPNDIVLFIAEDFLEDTKEAAYKLLDNAKPGTVLEKNLINQFTAHPPIAWRIIFP